ncbi:MAG: NUDIX hydrolase [Acidimicrobiales bacterium]
MRRRGGDQIIPRPQDWELGGPPPWPQGLDRIDLDPLLSTISARGPGRGADPYTVEFRWSAVLIALFDGPRGAEVVLTRRAWHLRSHKGEVSFPGGKLDADETPVDAALREAWEEVCLDPAQVEVIGELDHLSTYVSATMIVPVVARLAERPVLRPGTEEVDRILTVPLADFLSPGTYVEERWARSNPSLPHTLYFFHLDDETVWGATARMLHQLLSIATGIGR